jgi:hypothetical protein
MTFDELITPEERVELEHAIEDINRVLRWGTMVCGAITDFIDARFDGKA